MRWVVCSEEGWGLGPVAYALLLIGGPSEGQTPRPPRGTRAKKSKSKSQEQKHKQEQRAVDATPGKERHSARGKRK